MARSTEISNKARYESAAEEIKRLEKLLINAGKSPTNDLNGIDSWEAEAMSLAIEQTGYSDYSDKAVEDIEDYLVRYSHAFEVLLGE